MVVRLGDLVMILDLHRQGLGVSAIARRTGLDRKTVRKYIESGLEPPAYGPRQPRPAKVGPFEPFLRGRVAAFPDLTGSRLHREIRDLGYAGGYTAVKDFLREARPSAPAGFEVRFETAPGRQAPVDFAHFRTVFADEPGVEHVVWLFSLVLGRSRMLWGRFVPQQDLQTLLRCHAAAFEALGGVPAEVLYGRMRTVFMREDADGSFRNLGDLNGQLRQWLDQVATPRTHATTRRVVQEHFADERPSLQPLPAGPFQAVLRLERRIARDGMVSVDGNLHSVPDTTRRRPVEVHSTAHELRILEDGQVVAVHPVLDGRGQRRIIAGHRTARAPANSHTPRNGPAPGRTGDVRRTSRFDVVALRPLAFYDAVAKRLARKGTAAWRPGLCRMPPLSASATILSACACRVRWKPATRLSSSSSAARSARCSPRSSPCARAAGSRPPCRWPGSPPPRPSAASTSRSSPRSAATASWPWRRSTSSAATRWRTSSASPAPARATSPSPSGSRPSAPGAASTSRRLPTFSTAWPAPSARGACASASAISAGPRCSSSTRSATSPSARPPETCSSSWSMPDTSAAP